MNKFLIKKYWSKYKIFIKLIITLILFYLIIIRIDFSETFSYFKKINLLIIIPFILYPLGIYISTIKWKIGLNAKIKIYKLFKIYWISNFFSNFLPSTIGGDSYKLITLKKYGLKDIFKSVILDRGSGVFSLLLLLSIFGINLYFFFKNNFFIYVSLLFLLLVLLFIIIFIFAPLEKTFLSKYKIILKNNLNKLFILILLSLIFIFLGGIAFWSYFLMFDIHLNFYHLFLIYLMVQLISMLPISLNGWGLREYSFIYLVGLLGVPPEISLAIALISRFAGLIASSFGGLIYLFDRSD
ncbi:MAG: lysylphosphatidylglycerol synthase transmembrane domain-containing protein [Nanoarchaeota archaeon]